MAEEKRRSIKLMYGGKYHIGTLYEPYDGKFIYDSNLQVEKDVQEAYFLPKSYDAMAGSNYKSAEEFPYISEIVAKLKNRPDLIRILGIEPDSTAFDILYKLAEHSNGNSVGDNIGFCVDEKETQNEC